MNWSDPPSFEDVQRSILELGRTKGKIRALEAEIQLKTLDIRAANPRKPWLIQEATLEEQKELAALQTRQEELEAEVKFYDVWVTMFRQVSYNGSRVL